MHADYLNVKQQRYSPGFRWTGWALFAFVNFGFHRSGACFMTFPLITFCFIFNPFAISTWRPTWRRAGITAGQIGGWVVWNLMTAQATLWLAAIASRPCALLSGLVRRVTTCPNCGWTLLFVFIAVFYTCFLTVLTPHGADWTYWARARRTAICQARQHVSSLAVCWYSRFACGF